MDGFNIIHQCPGRCLHDLVEHTILIRRLYVLLLLVLLVYALAATYIYIDRHGINIEGTIRALEPQIYSRMQVNSITIYDM